MLLACKICRYSVTCVYMSVQIQAEAKRSEESVSNVKSELDTVLNDNHVKVWRFTIMV